MMRRLPAVGAGLGAALSGLTWLAARSDVRFRGCRDIDRVEWAATANCADGRFAPVLFGDATVVLGAIAVRLIWKRHA